MKIYNSEADFFMDVQKNIASENLTKIFEDALMQGILNAEQEASNTSNKADGLNLQIGNRVLRDQDLPVLELIGMVGSAITIVLAPEAIAAGALVAGMTSFAKLVWSTWRNTSKLSAGEIAILGLLKLQGPLSQEDLQALAEKALPNITRNDISASLLSLTDVEQLDGDIVELVRKDASGRWRVRGT